MDQPEYDKAICESKSVFYDLIQANDAARFMQTKLGQQKHIQSYTCPYCGLFHLTSTGRSRRRKQMDAPTAHTVARTEAEHWIKRKGWDKIKPKVRVRRYRF